MEAIQRASGMELWTAQDGSIQAVSRWESKESVEEYLQNPLFQPAPRRTATGNADACAHYSVDVSYRASHTPEMD
jgi:heme-degrading monooxygenase HmoA